MSRPESAASGTAARSAGALLKEAGAVLAAAGIEEPAREALRILAGLRDTGTAAVWLERERPLATGEAESFAEAVRRRAAGEPLAYVTGRIGFRTLTLRVDRRVLIPRPETEGLVERVLALVPRGDVADVGTGSGCIALSLAAEGRYRSVSAVDRSAGALEVARGNARTLGLPVAFLRGDLADALGADRLDALVSNPPYLTDDEYAALDRAVRDWEPEPALPSGPDGLAATDRLLADGRRVLRPGGWLALEVDCTRAAEAARRAAALGWRAVRVDMDLYGRERYLLAQRSDET